MTGNDRSLLMENIVHAVQPIAVSDLGVLIGGEPGTGKRWLAQLIHQMSGRSAHVFSEVRCSSIAPERIESTIFGRETVTGAGISITRGVLEQCSGGTLYLGTISDLPLTVLERIANAVQHRTFRRVGGYEEITTNVRIIASLAGPFHESTWQGARARGILYRLAPVSVKLPPLRERKRDILTLMDEFVGRGTSTVGSNTIKGISCDALRVFLIHRWPGNVRELLESLEYASLMCHDEFIQKHHLPPHLQELATMVDAHWSEYAQEMESVEHLIVEHTLQRSGDERTEGGPARGTTESIIRKSL